MTGTHERVGVVVMVAVMLLSMVGTGVAFAEPTSTVESQSVDDGSLDEQIEQSEEQDRYIKEASEHGDSVTSGDSSGITTQSTSAREIRVEAGRVSIENGSRQITLISSVVNTSGPVPNGVEGVGLTINVTDPDDSTQSFSRTTNAAGSVTIEYNPQLNGSYDVRVDSPAVADTTYGVDFAAGPKAVFFPGWHDVVEVDREVTVGVGLFDGDSPAANTQRTVNISTPSGSKIERTYTTDAGGTDTFTFTPSEAGDYRISGDGIESGLRLEAGDVTGKVQFNGPYADNIKPGQTVGVYGQLKNDSSPFANKEIEVEIINRGNDTEVYSANTSTNSYGQFITEWQTSTANTDDYEIDVTAADGSSVAVHGTGIDAEQVDAPVGDPAPSVDLSAEYRNEDYSATFEPGEQATVDFQLTNGSTPVSDADIEYRGTVDYRGALLVSGSETTNATGEATATITVPESAPRTDDFRLTAYATLNGTTYSETVYGAIDSVELEQENDYQTSPGSALNYSTTATSAASGEGVANVPTQVFLESNAFHASVIGTDTVTTGSDGVGETQFTTPQQTGELFFADWGPYRSPNHFSSVDSESYDVTIETGAEEYTPGDNVTVSYSTRTDEEVSANLLVAAGDDDIQKVERGLLVSNQMTPGETVEFTIPETTPEIDDYEITVSASTLAGDRTVEYERIDIVGSGSETVVAAADSYNPIENETLSISEPGVLGNDNGNGLTASIVSGPSNGSLTLFANGSFEYTPADGFSGEDQFTYEATNDAGDTDQATVTLYVESSDTGDSGSSGPVVVSSSLSSSTVTPGENLTASFEVENTGEDTGVILDARLPDNWAVVDTSNDGGTYRSDTQSWLWQTVESGSTNSPSLTVSVPDDASGSYGISGTAKVSDGFSDITNQSVTVDSDAQNSPPTANDVSVSTTENSSVSGTFDASDSDGDSLSYTVAGSPDNGEVSTTGEVFTYTPASGFSGTDTFTYEVSDGNGGTDTATVSVTVRESVDSPVTVSSTLSSSTATPGKNLTVSYSVENTGEDTGVILDARLPDNWAVVDTSNDGGTYRSDTQSWLWQTVESGSTNSPSLTVSVPDDASGSYGISGTAKVSDGVADTTSQSVTVEADSQNSPPSANDVSVSTIDDNPVGGTFDASDPDSDSLSYSITDGPANGEVTTDGEKFTYTAASGFSGTDSFSYEVSDGNGGTDTATVVVTVEDGDSVESLSASLSEETISAGTDTSLTVTATLVDGSTQDVTNNAALSVADDDIATVFNNGTVTGETTGSTTLTAEYNGETATADLTVAPAAVESLSASLTESTITTITETSMTVTATLTDGTTQDVTTDAELTTSDENVVTITDDGIVTGQNSGNTTLTAEYADKTDTVEVMVTEPAPPEITNLTIDEDLTRDQITVSGEVQPGTTSVETFDIGVRANFTSYTWNRSKFVSSNGGEFTQSINVENLVSDGNYTGYAVATDTVGTETELENDSVTVDTTPPVIRPRVRNLSNDPATLSLESKEQFNITDIRIEAESESGETEDRTPASILTGMQSEFTGISFNGTQVGTSDTTFSIEITAQDKVGNQITNTINSSITGYEIDDNGRATVDPDSIDGSFVLNTNATGSGSAVVGQSDAPPANTSTESDQITGEFIDVTDIGVSETNLTNATVRIPLSTVDSDLREKVDNDSFELFRSEDGEPNYSSTTVTDVRVETINDTAYVVGETPGFSVFAVGVTDTTAPEVTDTDINPGTEPAPNQSATATFEYTDEISAIDISATRIEVSGPNNADIKDGRISKQITDSTAEVTVEALEASESVELKLTVFDTAGNRRTTTETIQVQAASDDGGDDGSGGGGGGLAPLPQPTQPPTLEEPDNTTDEPETGTGDEPVDDEPVVDDEPEDPDTDTGGSGPEDDEPEEVNVPGFGVPITLAALFGAALLAARRQR